MSSSPILYPANAVASSSKPSSLSERNLLDHVNKIRQAPSFAGFETVLRMTGNDWMEAILQQANTIRQNWAAEYEANSAKRQTNLAGEMLKSPSRKKAVSRIRQASSKATVTAKQDPDANPFKDAEDKENGPVPAVNVSHPTVQDSTGTARSTRGRSDKSQIVKLPNPFQTKLLQSKGRAANRPTKDTDDDDAAAIAPGEFRLASLKPKAGNASPPKPRQPHSLESELPHVQKHPPSRGGPVIAGKKDAGHKESLRNSSLAEADAQVATQSSLPPPNTEDQAIVDAQPQPESDDADQQPPQQLGPDDSMAAEVTLTSFKEAQAEPKASTPTSHRSSLSRTGKARVPEETLAPIADSVDSGEEAAAELMTENLAGPVGKEGRANEGQDKSETAADGIQTEPNEQPEADDSVSSVAVEARPTASSAAPRQKRTLASFGGRKKSLTSTTTTQAPVSIATPAAAGFKSSFLAKSLRQASMRKGRDDDEAAEISSMFDSGSTRANTQANAGPTAEEGDALGASAVTAAPALPRTSGNKRGSEEVRSDGPPRKKVSISHSGQPTAAQPSEKLTAQTATASQNGPSANLLRSKLESARLHKAANPGSVGLGTRGLTSPILRAGGFGSAPTSPDLGVSKSKFQAAHTRPQIVPSSSTVAQLLDTWEARGSSAQSSPRKSNGPSTIAARLSPSRLPVPVSTTPQGSPVRRQLTQQQAFHSSVRPATHTIHHGATKAQPEEKRLSAVKSRSNAAQVSDSDPDAKEDESTSSTSAVTANATGKFEDVMKDEAKESQSPPPQPKDKDGALPQPQSAQSISSDQDDGEVADDEDEPEVHGVGAKPARPLGGREMKKGTVEIEESLDLRKNLPDMSGDATSLLQEDLCVEKADAKQKTSPAPAVPAASAATQAVPASKPSAVLSTTASTTAGESSQPASIAASQGGSGWSSRLKGLFGIAGVPTALSAGPPPPGAGFQPKLSRSMSGVVRDGSRDAIQSTSSNQSTANRRPVGEANPTGKPASVIRAEQVRRKEAEEAERRSREREDKRKQLSVSKAGSMAAPSTTASQASAKLRAGGIETESKKRTLEAEDQGSSQRVGTSSNASSRLHAGHRGSTANAEPRTRLMNQLGSTVNGNVGKQPVRPQQTVAGEDGAGKKRRLSQEREMTAPTAVSGKTAPSKAGSSTKSAAATSNNRTAAGNGSTTVRQAKVAMASATTGSQSRAPVQNSKARAPQQQTNFTQQNPFQQARAAPGPAQPPGRPASALSHHRPPAAPAAVIAATTAITAVSVQDGTVAPNIEDDNVSLPSIVSEYSDSEDEETQARRARAADWTKGDALQLALRAQSNMDADLIFGVPTGSVDLETLMPPQDPAARARMHRPRTSSANWHGADGLAQWEIDRYNQRMNINGPGFRLPARSAASTSSGHDRLGPNGQDHRRSVLALGLGAAAAARQQQSRQH